ncbi:MAG: HEAT repeat domain-containing protein [Planctomycetes bacterium]|nr:HEAT repeat domain-containing protein [Planctomycetota bacterium]
MEELIRIRLRGPGSSSPVPILVDASRKISSQIEMFLRKLGLQIDSGDPAYDVHHAESRKILDSSRSFREAGVRENHVLVLLPRVAPPPPPPEPPPEACDHGLRPPRPPRKPEAIVAFETAVREVREGRRSLFELDAPLAAAAAVAADADHITRLFETIGRMKLLSGIPWAAEQLRNGSSKVREGAVRLLSRLQAEDRAGEIRPLLSDPSGEVRGQAALAMSRFDAEEAAPAVLALLEDPEPLARAGAAQALERIPVKGREDRYLKLLQDSEPVVREAAVDGLAEVAPAALRERLDRLLQDPLQEVRAAACRAARNLKHSAAIPSLLTLLRKEGPDADNAMRALADLGAKEVSDLLRLKLDGPSEWDQVNAVEMLTRLGTVERRDLLPFAAHKDEMLRQAAVKGFVRLGAREDIVPFLSDADPKVQVEACAALGGPAEIQRLRSFLSDRSPEVRSAAAKALAGLKVRDAAPELTPLLLDAEPGVRMNAVHALTELEYLPAVPSIAPMLGDEDIRVRLFSGVALRVLGSPALGPDLLPLLSAPHSRNPRSPPCAASGPTRAGRCASRRRRRWPPSAIRESSVPPSIRNGSRTPSTSRCSTARGSPSSGRGCATRRSPRTSSTPR